MHRRDLFRSAIGGAAALSSASTTSATAATPPLDDRAYMSGLLRKMAEPVLSNMAQGRLRQNFKRELSPTWDGRDPAVTYMEAFGRLISGVAPWLTLPDDTTAEGRIRHKLRQDALQSYVHAVDPKSPNYLLWRSEGQALVDSAYVTNALIRAPKALWEPLDAATKSRLIAEIKGLRRVEPPYTNWLLFAAMNEAFLLSVGEDYDPMRLNTAVRKINEWYVGDGWIKDGETFHFDYYGSFVIHPFMVEILEVLARHNAPYWRGKPADLLAQALKRMQRYGEHLERFISPEGTFPPIGRSLTYRTAAFQPLALLAWRKQLPQSLPEGQVRAALTAAHKAIFTHPSNFDEGYLTIGFAGHQPALGDWYSNNGSMYITASSFLALGLPKTDSYWTAPAQDWTSKKAFANAPFPKDYHVDY
ncbi:DUF2264 domain-containing protein [Asticcacaulis tiandongensis]|uniref:DUF2264 domain-containing protein n=1 Tax=Asticcacaulis tiandongensis TaxID=2565365 RepID=UPI001126404A|nr:DUF2264 domain-containing protein [Asticcacaulis tiandongensis]